MVALILVLAAAFGLLIAFAFPPLIPLDLLVGGAAAWEAAKRFER